MSACASGSSPSTTCEWMFGDAATGLLGFHRLAQFNPLRWSGAKPFDAAIFQLEEVLKENDRPIMIKAPANTGKAVRLPSTQQAINFLKRCEQVHDAQTARAPTATIRRVCLAGNACVGNHTEYELEVCEDVQQWNVRRRYSEFIDLNLQLKAVPGFQCPDLPPKGMFGFRHACNIGDFNEKRREGLDKYLSETIVQTASLADVRVLGEFLDVFRSDRAQGETARNVFNKIDPQVKYGLPKPIFMLPANAGFIEGYNGIIEVAFAESEDVANGVEVTVVFRDEDRPNHVEDVIYDIMRRPLLGRSADIETFTFVRGPGGKFDRVAFKGTYSGNQEWSCKAPSHLSETVKLNEFMVDRSHGHRVLIWVNVWNHLFGNKNNNPAMEHERVEDYPCTHGLRNDVESRYRR